MKDLAHRWTGVIVTELVSFYFVTKSNNVNKNKIYVYSVDEHNDVFIALVVVTTIIWPVLYET